MGQVIAGLHASEPDETQFHILQRTVQELRELTAGIGLIWEYGHGKLQHLCCVGYKGAL